MTPTKGETSNQKRQRSLDRLSIDRSLRHPKRTRKSSVSRSRSGGPPSTTRRRQDQKDDRLPVDESLAALKYTTSDYGILGAWIMKDRPAADEPVDIATSLSRLAESAVSTIVFFLLNMQLLILYTLIRMDVISLLGGGRRSIMLMSNSSEPWIVAFKWVHRTNAILPRVLVMRPLLIVVSRFVKIPMYA